MPKCSFTDCNNEGIYSDFEVCNNCLQFLMEEVAVKSAENFGVPKVMGCGECGNWFHQEDFLKHLPCQESVDAEIKKT